MRTPPPPLPNCRVFQFDLFFLRSHRFLVPHTECSMGRNSECLFVLGINCQHGWGPRRGFSCAMVSPILWDFLNFPPSAPSSSCMVVMVVLCLPHPLCLNFPCCLSWSSVLQHMGGSRLWIVHVVHSYIVCWTLCNAHFEGVVHIS